MWASVFSFTHFPFRRRPRRPYLAGTGRRRMTPASPERQTQTDFTDAASLPHPNGGVNDHALVVRVIGAAPTTEKPWVPWRMEAPTASLAALDPRMWYPPDAPTMIAASDGDETPRELHGQAAELQPSQLAARQPAPVMIRAEHYPQSESPCLRHVLEGYSIHEQVQRLEEQARRATAAVRPLFDTGESLLQMRAAMATKQQEDRDREHDLRMAALGRYQKVTPGRRGRGSLDTGVFPTVGQSQFGDAPSGWESTR